MKISIITIHDIGNNYGSTLQSCALCEFLNNNGYQTQIINYIPKYKSYLGEIRTLVVNTLFLYNYISRKKSFDSYYKEHAVLSAKYTKYAELVQSPPKADVYMVGSDQVWNPYFPCGQDEAYYLNFIKSNNKMAYASSIGRLLDDVQLNTLKNKIKHFRFISIREKESQVQLDDIGVHDVEYVLDPIFLFPKNYYLKVKQPNNIGKYLLVYAVNHDELLEKVALEIAAKYDLKIVLIGGFDKKCRCDIFLRSAGPVEFINLINNAEFVLNSSFHGTALSLILNKKFAVIQPKINSLRVENILETAELSERILKSIDDIKNIEDEIDYNKVNYNLEKMIEHSKMYLLNCLRKFE